MSIIAPSECTIEAYHKASWLSHSKLKTFAEGGPRLFYVAHIQQSFQREETDPLRFGKALELLAFHPKEFEAKYVIKPAGKEGDGRTVEGKAWKAAFGHLDHVSAAELAHMQEMVAALEENDTAQELMRACTEQTTYTTQWAIGEQTLEMASRPDFGSLRGCAASGFSPFTFDLKSTENLERLRAGNAIKDYGYHSQAALAQSCVDDNAATGSPLPRAFLGVVEKHMPYRSEVFELDAIALDKGLSWCQHQAKRIAFHLRSGEWPRVNLEIQTVGLPRWAEREED